MALRKSISIPFAIKEELGGWDFNLLLTQPNEWWVDKFQEYRWHRFTKVMGKRFYSAIQDINIKYKGNVSSIWKGKEPKNTRVVIGRLLEFDGVGPKLAHMIVNILIRRGIEMIGKDALDISADVHVMRVFYRLGFVDDSRTPTKTIESARQIFPTFPGMLDIFSWQLGKDVCTAKEARCELCPLAQTCPSSC